MDAKLRNSMRKHISLIEVPNGAASSTHWIASPCASIVKPSIICHNVQDVPVYRSIDLQALVILPVAPRIWGQRPRSLYEVPPLCPR